METKTCKRCKINKQFSEFIEPLKNQMCKDCKNECIVISRIKVKNQQNNRIQLYFKSINENYIDSFNNKKLLSNLYRLRCKYYKKIIRFDLHNSYLKQKAKNIGFTTEDINENPQILEVIKLITLTKRQCATSRN